MKFGPSKEHKNGNGLYIKLFLPLDKCDYIKCHEVYDPVCGDDNQTYSNKCMLDWVACRQNKQTTVVHKGECRENSLLNKDETETLIDKCKYITCSGVYDPVCGDNGQTYSNECMMEFAACKEMKAISLAYKGSCFEGMRKIIFDFLKNLSKSLISKT